jgi:predicted PurR-regulated permease PerM
MERERALVLGGLLAVFVALSYVVLAAVLQVLVFAITVAYVLYPLRERLHNRGLSRRLASGIATVVALLAVALLLAPLVFAVYQRRDAFLELLGRLPETLTVEVAEFSYEIEIAAFEDAATTTLQDIAVEFAVAVPEQVLALMLFVLVLYGLLYRPLAPGYAIYGAVPDRHHDIVTRLHERTREVLFALYVIQASTAAGTAVVAVVLFAALGYAAPVWLALIAGILQFIPVVGPSVLIIGLGGADLLFFDAPRRGVAVLVLGLPLIGLLPDVVIRPKLAHRAGDFSSTLYFVGFVGGLLTVGPIGVIVGPLVVALLVETLDTLIEDEGLDHDGGG